MPKQQQDGFLPNLLTNSSNNHLEDGQYQDIATAVDHQISLALGSNPPTQPTRQSQAPSSRGGQSRGSGDQLSSQRRSQVRKEVDHYVFDNGEEQEPQFKSRPKSLRYRVAAAAAANEQRSSAQSSNRYQQHLPGDEEIKASQRSSERQAVPSFEQNDTALHSQEQLNSLKEPETLGLMQ